MKPSHIIQNTVLAILHYISLVYLFLNPYNLNPYNYLYVLLLCMVSLP